MVSGFQTSKSWHIVPGNVDDMSDPDEKIIRFKKKCGDMSQNSYALSKE